MPRPQYDFFDHGKDVTVVLVHAFTTDRTLWRDQLPALTDYNVLVYDVICHGSLNQWSKNFSMDDAAAQLYALIQEVGVTRYVLVGISMGGFILQSYADRYGGAEGYMIIGATPSFADCYAPWELSMLQMTDDLFPLFVTPILPFQLAALSTMTPYGFYRYLEAFDIGSDHIANTWSKMNDFYQNKDIAFDAPLQICCGQFDCMGTNLLHLDDWQKYYERVSTQIIFGAGHLANLDQPQQFNFLLRRFVADCIHTAAE